MWQPIETAPRDGSQILFWDRHHHVIGRWGSLYVKRDGIELFGWARPYDPGSHIQWASHWMPLPEAPEDERL